MLKLKEELNIDEDVYEVHGMYLISLNKRIATFKVNREDLQGLAKQPLSDIVEDSIIKYYIGTHNQKLTFEIMEDGQEKTVSYSWGQGTSKEDFNTYYASKYAYIRVLAQRLLANIGYYQYTLKPDTLTDVSIKEFSPNKAYDLVPYYTDNQSYQAVHFNSLKEVKLYELKLKKGYWKSFYSDTTEEQDIDDELTQLVDETIKEAGE